MNFIIVVSDTLRRDHLGCYGNGWISTPNIDKLARESIVFDRAYCGSFPTVPHRSDLLTGKFTFTYRDWSPLSEDEIVLAQVLGEAGYVSMMVVDTPHILRDGYRFDRGFAAWRWIRGQENDRYSTAPRDIKLPCDPRKLRSPEGTVKQYLRNVSDRRGEGDCFVSRTMREAANWLERNRDQEKFLLYVDTFDPHEPWDAPREYVDMYDPGYDGEEVFYPAYGPCDYLSQPELKHIKALYAAEVSLVDKWVGMLLDRADELGALDEATVIFTSDHGFYFGEHGLIGKSIVRGSTSQAVPLYEELVRIPLIVRLPGGERGGRRVNEFVQPADLMPTILDLAGIEAANTVQGTSLVPLVEGQAGSLREGAISSWSIIHGPKAWRPSTITVDEWALIYAGQVSSEEDRPTTSVVDSVPRTEELPWAPSGPELYRISTDPAQSANVFDLNIDVAKQLHALYLKFLRKVNTPQRFLKCRMNI